VIGPSAITDIAIYRRHSVVYSLYDVSFIINVLCASLLFLFHRHLRHTDILIFFIRKCIIGWCVRRFGILIVTRKFWFYKQSVRVVVCIVLKRVCQRLTASEQRDSVVRAVVSILNY